MKTPDFFDRAPRLLLRDPLAEFLGAAREGLIEYTYADSVKLAGHSCPTVAGAHLLAAKALALLYPDAIPERGAIRVEMRDAQDAGVTGVIAGVLGLITGAAGDGGFKGIGGRFVRRGLLAFGVPMEGLVRFTRTDTGASVELDYRPERVAGDPATRQALGRALATDASPSERERFAALWQDRVREILVQGPSGSALLEVARASA
jgi:hypothetical protein